MDDHPRSPVNIAGALPAAARALAALEKAVAESSLDRGLFELVKLRASQINGCAYCIDMHTKDAKAAGETDDRLTLLSVWREVDLYTDAERAALALAEAMTLISVEHVPAAVEDAARAAFDPEGYAALVFAVIAINAWNRMAITGHSPAGQYQPGQLVS
jgi:AhpD family alkylhydroperoxidase